MIHELEDLLRIIVPKDPTSMTEEELRENYRDLLGVIIGMFIGAKMSTDQIKTLLQKNDKKKKASESNR